MLQFYIEMLEILLPHGDTETYLCLLYVTTNLDKELKVSRSSDPGTLEAD